MTANTLHPRQKFRLTERIQTDCTERMNADGCLKTQGRDRIAPGKEGIGRELRGGRVERAVAGGAHGLARFAGAGGLSHTSNDV